MSVFLAFGSSGLPSGRRLEFSDLDPDGFGDPVALGDLEDLGDLDLLCDLDGLCDFGDLEFSLSSVLRLLDEFVSSFEEDLLLFELGVS